MFWVVQSNLYREDGHARLLSALDRLGSRYVEVQVLPFTDELFAPEERCTVWNLADRRRVQLPYEALSEPVFVMGSYKLVRILSGPGSAMQPGAFLDNLEYPQWAAGWGHENLLNPSAWVGPLSEAEVARPSFVRPTADTKAFAGHVFHEPGAFEGWRAASVAEGTGHVPPDTEVLVAPEVRGGIHYEVRTWVVDGQVVTASLYRRGGRLCYSDQVDPEAVRFAQACVDRWQPSPVFVLDVARTDAGMKVVEANCLSAAGFYAGDMQKLVSAVEDHFAGRRPGTLDLSKGVHMEIGTGVMNVSSITHLELWHDPLGTVVQESEPVVLQRLRPPGAGEGS